MCMHPTMPWVKLAGSPLLVWEAEWPPLGRPKHKTQALARGWLAASRPAQLPTHGVPAPPVLTLAQAHSTGRWSAALHESAHLRAHTAPARPEPAAVGAIPIPARARRACVNDGGQWEDPPDMTRGVPLFVPHGPQ
jgi:hypothetical protein